MLQATVPGSCILREHEKTVVVFNEERRFGRLSYTTQYNQYNIIASDISPRATYNLSIVELPVSKIFVTTQPGNGCNNFFAKLISQQAELLGAHKTDKHGLITACIQRLCIHQRAKMLFIRSEHI